MDKSTLHLLTVQLTNALESTPYTLQSPSNFVLGYLLGVLDYHGVDTTKLKQLTNTTKVLVWETVVLN